jgi:4-hydroxybenzoate polyprenyltransferase
VQSHHPQWKLFNTICDSTEKRQAEVKHVAQQVDALVVVGGRDSGNTRRLVEIARQAGKPAFHVETEAELDAAALAGFRLIGVTAGASTPHWIIRRVCRKLENLTPDQHRSWRGMLHGLRRALLMTQLYVSIGAGCLCYACAGLYGAAAMGRHALIAFLYVLLMHIVNNLTGQKTARYTDPDKAAFYCRHRLPLTLLAGFSGIGGLWVAWGAGPWVFLTLLVMSILGLVYDVRVLPTRILAGRSLKIKSIPGSKTILISFAWGMVAAVLPGVTAPSVSWPAMAVVFAWATGIVFIRTAFFDILDIQTDRIVGKETLATLLGEKRTLKLLYGVAAASTVLILGACAGGLTPFWGCLLAVVPMVMRVILRGYARGRFLPGMELEFWVETQFIFAGLLALMARLI